VTAGCGRISGPAIVGYFRLDLCRILIGLKQPQSTINVREVGAMVRASVPSFSMKLATSARLRTAEMICGSVIPDRKRPTGRTKC